MRIQREGEPYDFESMQQTLVEWLQEGESYVFLLPIYMGLLLAERLAHVFLTTRRWDNWDTAVNLLMTGLQLLLNVFIGHLVPVALMALIFLHTGFLPFGDGVWGWVAAFLVYDLVWYVDHRIAHRVGFLWAMHHVHHSSCEYNTTVASRGFLLDMTFLSRPTFYVLPLLGVSPFQFIVISIATNIWGIAQHTRLVGRLKGLDVLFATPSNHRVHHGKNPKYIDRNYGEVLMIWDHLFGTYQREEEEPTYGVVRPIETYNLVGIQCAGVGDLRRKCVAAIKWPDKVRALIYPPEWTPPAEPEEAL